MAATMSEQVQSVRTDGDSWDITESVGATALGVAASRAAETARPDPLIRDEFAGPLVAAAGRSWARLTDPDSGWLDPDDRYGHRIHAMARDYQAVRTHFFDTFVTGAAAAGIRQVVILAAGLDSRAYRLGWPAGTTVFEIDQPRVLDYKAETLAGQGAQPVADRRPVAVDLREDWPAALGDAGFESDRPTAWLAEGLLPYLPADAQGRLFAEITALSAPGSRIAVESFRLARPGEEDERHTAFRERAAGVRERLGIGVDIATLTYREPDRPAAADLLNGHDWLVTVVESHDEMARLGRPVPDDLLEQTTSTLLLTAQR
ncbi:SAM-dependent methyltransferase [Mycolicibacillus trivialis]|uniref:S-adenosyl-L-methionine-dependent methyltransferase n=1 Tax=Mycolicibacillus trivialis TaxID=1798 RepID=A0A1X2EI80_9MYCO|nr:SAM-dependent methyltransferase [Mycolicibacillus trivialis]